MCGDAKIVGDDDEGLAVFVLEAEHFVEDMLGEIAVERAGGLVGEDQIPGLQYASCEGDALLMGHSIVHEPELAKAQLNVSPQETAVAPNLTVRENLCFIAQLYGSDSRSAREKAAQMIADFHLEDKADKQAKTLSGGQQRRLSIAMALISQPKLLFLDEPTLGLDVLARRELWQQMLSHM